MSFWNVVTQYIKTTKITVGMQSYCRRVQCVGRLHRKRTVKNDPMSTENEFWNVNLRNAVSKIVVPNNANTV